MWHLSFWSPHQNPEYTFALPHTCHMPRPSQRFWVDHPDNKWRGHFKSLLRTQYQRRTFSERWFFFSKMDSTGSGSWTVSWFSTNNVEPSAFLRSTNKFSGFSYRSWWYFHIDPDDILNIYSPKKAVGDIIPVLLATRIAIPVSMNGTVKSTTASLSELIISDVITISVFRLTSSAIRPFHFPFWNLKTWLPVRCMQLTRNCTAI